MQSLKKLLVEKGLRVVEGEGPPGAKIAIVGEALGSSEAAMGHPFVGPSGLMLNESLEIVGLRREECYVTNVCTIRPPNNDLDRLPELGLSFRDFIPDLEARLRRLSNLNTIVAIGGRAAEVLAGVDKVTKWRGSVLDSILIPGVYVIPTFHPAHIIRSGEQTFQKEQKKEGAIRYDYGTMKVCLRLDLKRAKEVSQNGYTRPFRTLIDQPNFNCVVDFMERISPNNPLAFDIETAGFEITRVALAPSHDLAISVPLLSDSFTSSELEEIWKRLRDLFWTHKFLIAQNGHYDMTMFQASAPVWLLHFDTMVAHHLLYSELPHSLDFLTSIYTKEPYYKWMSETNNAKYNCLDAVCTFEVAEGLKKELKELGQEDLFYGFSMPLMNIMSRTSWEGIRIDQDAVRELDKHLTNQINQKETELDQIVGHTLNVRSTKQMSEFLYDELKLSRQKHKKTGNTTTDENAIAKLVKISKHPSLPVILRIRELRTIHSMFVSKQIDEDQRWRCDYSVTGTDTGRLSSRKTIFGTGANLQNIPRPPKEKEDEDLVFIKRTMVADPGFVLLEADLAQAEVRLVAWFAQDESMKEIFRQNKDIHRWNASSCFEKPEDQITKDERYFAKRVVHAFNYGFGVYSLCDLIRKEMGMEYTRKQAEEKRENYFKRCPSIRSWQREIEETINRTRVLINPFNRRRLFLGRLGPDTYRKGYAQLPQSTCVDYLNRILLHFYIATRDEEETTILMQVHDSLVVQCRESEVARNIKILREEAEVGVEIKGSKCIIPLEFKWGPNWGEMREVK